MEDVISPNNNCGDNLNMECLKDCYRNKNVLVTGHTGFKGSWLSILLKELGARVTGYSLEPNTDRDNYVQTNLASKLQSYIGDIRDHRKLMQVFTDCQPDLYFIWLHSPWYEDPIWNPRKPLMSM